MIHEYALEPELVASWHERRRAIFFAKEFGSYPGKSDTGRVVSRYPEHWKDLVWEAFETTFGDKATYNDRRRLDSILNQLRERMVRRSECIWDDEKDWLINAETEHRDRPFHAILARKNPRQNTNVMSEGDVWQDKARRWDAPSTVIVRRYANKMAECVAPMLRCATKVLFVDPYFRASTESSEERFRERFRRPLAEFLRAIGTRASQITIELHTAAYDKELSWEDFRKECEDYLPGVVPIGVTITVHRWKNSIEKLHNRYILTNLGGVLFGTGLDQGSPGTTDDVARLNRDVYIQRLRDYAGPNGTFDLDGEVFQIEGQATG